MHILPVHPIQQSQRLFVSGTGFPKPAGIAVHLSHGIQRKGIAEGVGKRAGFGVHLVALGNSHTDFSTEKGGFYKYSFQFEIGVIALGFIQLGQKAVGIQRVTLLPGQIVETEAVVKSGDDLMDYTILSFSLVQESALSVVDAIIVLPNQIKKRNIYSCFILIYKTLSALKVTFLMQRGLAKILYLFGTDKESVKITTF